MRASLSIGAVNPGSGLSSRSCPAMLIAQWCLPFRRQHAGRFVSLVGVSAKSEEASGRPKTASNAMAISLRTTDIKTRSLLASGPMEVRSASLSTTLQTLALPFRKASTLMIRTPLFLARLKRACALSTARRLSSPGREVCRSHADQGLLLSFAPSPALSCNRCVPTANRTMNANASHSVPSLDVGTLAHLALLHASQNSASLKGAGYIALVRP
jgi:hypothetical protein